MYKKCDIVYIKLFDKPMTIQKIQFLCRNIIYSKEVINTLCPKICTHSVFRRQYI